jgi:anti-anti-sigma factor
MARHRMGDCQDPSRRQVPAILVQRQDSHATVRLIGVLDSCSVASFNESIERLVPVSLGVVDLVATAFIDSAGLHAVIAAGDTLRAVGGDCSSFENQARWAAAYRMPGLHRIVSVFSVAGNPLRPRVTP